MARIVENRLILVDPRTGAEAGELACTAPEAVAGSVALARAAGEAWAARPLEERVEVVRGLAAAVMAHAAELAELLQSELGKPAGEAWTSEVVTAQELFDHWLGVVEDELEPVVLDLNPINYPGKRVELHPEPLGVVGLIMPWNYPIHLPLRTIVPALLAGNAVVFKPSEHAARCGVRLGEVMAAALPANLVVTVVGGPTQGAAVIEAGVDKVIFTGSVAGGRAVARHAAEKLVPTALELGSKDAAIVCADALFDRTVNGIVWGAFHNAGQDCASVERVLVDRTLHDRFVAAVVAATGALRVGEDVGPLVNEAALAKVHTQVVDAVSRGARLLCGGEPTGTGYFYPPTVVVDVPVDCALWREETFGPVLAVRAFDTEGEAVAEANNSPYGLTVSVWSKDVERAKALVLQVRCGVSYVNNCCFTGPMGGAAWGGRKESGYGVTGSRWSLHSLVQPRTVVVDRSRGKKELWWYPYTSALTTMARGLVEVGRVGGSKLVGVKNMLKGLIQRWKLS